VCHPKRDWIIKELRERKIEVKIYYPYPIHKMNGYKDFCKKNNANLPVTEKMSKGIFSLPIFPNLKTKDVHKIIKVLKVVLKKA